MISIRKASLMMLLGTSLLATSMLSHAEWVEWVLDPTVEFRNESNLNQSAFSSDEESDNVLRLAVEGGRYYQLADRSRLRLSADLEVQRFDEFDLLNSVAISGNLSLIHKFGVGQRAAWISPYLIFGYKDVDDDVRSGNFGDLGIATGKRLSDRFDMSASLAFIKSEGTGNNGKPPVIPGVSKDVFDQERWVASLNGNFLLSNRLLLLGTVNYFNGDLISNCNGSNLGTVKAGENILAITQDAVFGGCVYRLDGDGGSATLDLSYATGRHSSVNFGAAYQVGKGDVIEYQNTIFRASFLYRY